MRNKRFFIVLAGALLFGLLAAVSVSRYLSSAQAYTKNLNSVAVAKVAIPLGTKIIPEQLMVVQFPKESIRRPRCGCEYRPERASHGGEASSRWHRRWTLRGYP